MRHVPRLARPLVLAVALAAATAANAHATTLTIPHDSAPPGGAVIASGSGFAPGETVALELDGTATATATAAGDGALRATRVAVPSATPPGTHVLRATGRTSHRTRSAGSGSPSRRRGGGPLLVYGLGA